MRWPCPSKKLIVTVLGWCKIWWADSWRTRHHGDAIGLAPKPWGARWLRWSFLALLFVLIFGLVSWVVPILPHTKLKSDAHNETLLFSPDGHTLITTQGMISQNMGRLQTWDADIGKERFSLPVRWLQPCVSSDSRIVSDPDLKLWDVRTGEELANLKQPTDHSFTSDFCFSPDSQFLIEQRGREHSLNHGIHFWDLQLKKEIGETKGHLWSMAFDGETTILATMMVKDQGEPGQVLLWRLAPGQLPRLDRTIPISVQCLVLSPDGRQMLTASQPQDHVKPYDVPFSKQPIEFTLWDTATGGKSLTFKDKGWYPIKITWFSNGKLLGVDSSGDPNRGGGSFTFPFETSFWDLTSSPRKIGTLDHSPLVSPDGRWVAVSCAHGATLYKLPAMTIHGNLTHVHDDKVYLYPVMPCPFSYVFSPDSHFLVIANLQRIGSTPPQSWWWPRWASRFWPNTSGTVARLWDTETAQGTNGIRKMYQGRLFSRRADIGHAA